MFLLLNLPDGIFLIFHSVTLGKLLNVSVSKSPHMSSRDNESIYFIGFL